MHDSNSEWRISQIADLFRIILEPVAYDDIGSFFYENGYLEKLASVIDDNGSEDTSVSPFLIQSILDLLSFCIVSHPLLSKPYFLRFGSLVKYVREILIGTYRLKNRTIQLAAIRLVRAIFWQKDPLYYRFLTAFNIPGLVLQLMFVSRPDFGGLRDGNMIYSACLEIVTFVCVNNQVNVMESFCRPGSETERIVQTLANEISVKAHSEIFIYMLSTVEKLRSPPPPLMEDMNSRQSITSSRARSLSPNERPILVPRPRRRSTTILGNFEDFREEDDEDETSEEEKEDHDKKRIRFSSD